MILVYLEFPRQPILYNLEDLTALFDLLRNEFSKMPLITFEDNLKKEDSTIFPRKCSGGTD